MDTQTKKYIHSGTCVETHLLSSSTIVANQKYIYKHINNPDI